MTSEIIECVARAIHDSQSSEIEYHDLSSHSQDELKMQALAAITAMRKPTKAMIEAGHEGSKDAGGNMHDSFGFPPHLIPYCWEAMIDQALKD